MILDHIVSVTQYAVNSPIAIPSPGKGFFQLPDKRGCTVNNERNWQLVENHFNICYSSKFEELTCRLHASCP